MVSIKATVMGITLLTFCLLITDTSAARGGCCLSYSKGKIPFSAIKGYSVQTVTGICPISAIIFHTRRGPACTNPGLDWVMTYVNRLRNKAQKVHRETSQAHK
ncbi:C-C motif chemokine 20a.3 [Dicentrarchus labrax]|uniref:C-C motif chemokine n=1 Tax=Dicentrarchus labrax TaxID=13489 RepID=A0A8C4DBV8_DICLA|nr:C-C motif chemokine 20a.3 [Dicentrarchus labrax]